MTSEPAGGALIRAVDAGDRVSLIAVSRTDQSVRLNLSPGAFRDAADAPVTEPVILAPGAVCVLHRAGDARVTPSTKPAAKKKKPRVAKPAATPHEAPVATEPVDGDAPMDAPRVRAQTKKRPS